MTRSLRAEEAHRRGSWQRLLLAAGALLAVALAVGLLMDRLQVGPAVRALVEEARRIGGGRFNSGRAVVARDDELGDLAEALRSAAAQLEAARERALREAGERLAALKGLRATERLATVGRLASGVAHELGAPLDVTLARAKLIDEAEDVPERAREHARVIQEQARRMSTIIRNVLEFARGRAPTDAPTDLAPLVDDVAAVLEPLLNECRARVERLGEPALAVDLGREQLQQVLTNLVLNAAQAMPEGGVVTVTLGRRRATPPAGQGGSSGGEAEYATVTVSDTGIGIPPEVLPRIFEPFFTTKDLSQGTGLGLPVVEGIVGEHGGWVQVDSAPGRGSSFTLFLPPSAA